MRPVSAAALAGSERYSSLIVQEQYIKSREDMEAMERGRRAQAKEFQEKLDNQWKILTEMSTQIQNLVMISGPKESVQERADGDVFVGSEERVETESVLWLLQNHLRQCMVSLMLIFSSSILKLKFNKLKQIIFTRVNVT